jgi:NAD(P)H-dependent FMN reductase
MRIFSFAGSLRAKSFNAALLRELQSLAPSEVNFRIFQKLSLIPSFNPDLEDANPHPILKEFREEVASAKGILITSPEYVHGVPGVLKNALDWIVGSGELDGKPVAIINGSTGDAQWVKASLHEILGVMSAGKVIKEASFVVPAIKTKFDENGYLIDEALRKKLARSLEVLIATCKAAYTA